MNSIKQTNTGKSVFAINLNDRVRGNYSNYKVPDKKSDFTLLLKRVSDIVISSLVIIFLLSWLLPILAILIKLSSRGPVFFIQKRKGAGGKVFNCLKLRTMVVNNQANTKQAQENDPRITTLGSFLRKSCLDEFPQFINVFLGDMSIVGPRPHMLKDCEDFSKVIPHYEARHLVKPGITGLAQIKGYRGQVNNFYDVAHRYQWDMFYVRNLGFMLDMKIIRKTIFQTITATLDTLTLNKKNMWVVGADEQLIKNFHNQLLKESR